MSENQGIANSEKSNSTPKKNDTGAIGKKSFTNAPLAVFFLDSAKDFLAPQKDLLALAVHLREQGFVPHICCPSSSKLMQQALALDFACVSIMNAEAKKPSLIGLVKILLKQKRINPLCIHSFAENCLPLAQKIAKLRPQNNTIILHSCFEAPTGQANKALGSYWEMPRKIIFPSKYLANMWAEAGIKPAKLHTIHPAYDNLDAYKPFNGDRCVFVATEPLEQGSGLELLLKAMSALWQLPHLPEWEVRIVGAGSQFAKLLDEANSLGVASRLAMLSDQPLENIIPYAHVLISPHNNPQGNISALMSAFNVGMPLICTTVNAHMEVAHAGNALTVSDMDPQRLAAAMIELMCKPERMEHFAKLSATMQDYAKTQRLLEQYFKLYNDCIAHHGWVLPTNNNDAKASK